MAAPTWDTEIDVLVVGSGAGGMSAALAAKDCGREVLIVEKAKVYGGSTALSGGALWVPNNPTLLRAGIQDPVADVRTYLNSVVGSSVHPARLDAYVSAGPEALRFLEETSVHMRFSYVPDYPDYHPEKPGGRARGRSIEAWPIDLRELGSERQFLRPSALPLPPGSWVTCVDARYLAQAMRTWAGFKASLRLAWRMLMSLLLGRRIVGLGQALAARFRLAVRDAGIPLWLETPLERILRDDSGRVTGAEVLREGRVYRIRARYGIVLATGGFEHNQQMRSAYLAPASENFSAGSADNMGDGIRAGEAIGAAVALMNDAWWMPAVRLPDGSMFPLVAERSIPRSIIVNGHGVRYANESAPYVNFVHAQLEGERAKGKHIPSYMIIDAVAKRRYPVAGAIPGLPFPKAWFDTGLVRRASSLAELAVKIGVPPDALEHTVARFNSFAKAGIDADFHRGESAYDRYYGDPTLPSPVLDVIDQPPFYAITVVPGDLGTKGGLSCDEHSRVLDGSGVPIPALYATGNTSASVMGNDYAGAGATIGPAIVFGWIAARHACS